MENEVLPLIGYTSAPHSKYGYKVNFYRNNSVHPKENFDAGLSNVLLCGITLALYCSNGDKKDIKTSEIEERLKSLKDRGKTDLEELLKLF